jgi:phospholipid/cholesterol/gamma-HCH transport system ATP-binding protein
VGLFPHVGAFPVIRAVNLHKSFRRQQVLNGVNLEIPDGSIYVIIGRSGAGKSVLLKHFIGLLRPDEGEVWVDGEEISKLHGRALNRVRSRFGMLFQGGALFDSLTVYDNVAFPLREKTRLSEAVIREKVQERLAQVGLSGIDEKFPSELSGGMRKRVALARALISEPEFLLFDEPTTGLDPIRVNSIHQLILDLHRLLHLTAVVVSHEIPEIFSLATHVAMLHEGVIVATGTPAEIQASSDPVVHQFITGQTEGPIGSTE